MRIREALKVEGLEKYQLLNYLVIEADCFSTTVKLVREKFVLDDCKITEMREDSWSSGVVLVEFFYSDFDEIVREILDSSLKGLSVNGVNCSVCMFDGAFMSFGDLFNPDNAPQIYSMASISSGVNIAVDDPLRNSVEWKDAIIKLGSRVAL